MTERAKLFGYGASTYTRMALIAFEEKGAPFDFVEVASWAGYVKDPAFEGRHPFAKVPYLEHDGAFLYETTAIVGYVDEAFDGPALQPTGALARARMRQLISTTISYAWPVWVPVLAVERLFNPLMGDPVDEARLRAAAGQMLQAAIAIDELLGLRPDGHFDLADIVLIGAFRYASETPEVEMILRDAPRLRDWWARMEERPSVQRWAPAMDWAQLRADQVARSS